MTTHGDCWGQRPRDLARVRFVSGHIGYDFARHLMRHRYSFTFLREPTERILSMYHFCRSRDPRKFIIYQRAHELELEEFLRAGFTDPWVKKNIWNNQVWQLAHGYAHLDKRTINDFDETQLLSLAKHHLDELSFVGFTETFQSDAVVVLNALALPSATKITRTNVTHLRPRRDDLSSATVALLDELTQLDQQLYRHAMSRKSVGGST